MYLSQHTDTPEPDPEALPLAMLATLRRGVVALPPLQSKHIRQPEARLLLAPARYAIA